MFFLIALIAAALAWFVGRGLFARTGLPSRDTLPADPRLAAAVRRSRELAYGWPGGVPPKPRSSAS